MANKLGLAEARVVVEAILKAAADRELNFAGAVVDSGGEPIYLARMDGASPLNARMSLNKAYTATKWRQDTKAIKTGFSTWGSGTTGAISRGSATRGLPQCGEASCCAPATERSSARSARAAAPRRRTKRSGKSAREPSARSDGNLPGECHLSRGRPGNGDRRRWPCR
jgi:hypothetical protein